MDLSRMRAAIERASSSDAWENPGRFFVDLNRSTIAATMREAVHEVKPHPGASERARLAQAWAAPAKVAELRAALAAAQDGRRVLAVIASGAVEVIHERGLFCAQLDPAAALAVRQALARAQTPVVFMTTFPHLVIELPPAPPVGPSGSGRI